MSGGGQPNCFVSVSFQQPAHVKQNAVKNSKVGAACQAGLAVDLKVGLETTNLLACLPGRGLKSRRAYSA